MTDLYLWGSYFTPLAYFFFVIWLLTPFYKNRKRGWTYVKSDIGVSNIIKRCLLFIVITTFAITFGSAYRPKNTLPTVKNNYGKQRVSTEMTLELPRYESFESKSQKLDEYDKRQSEVLFGD